MADKLACSDYYFISTGQIFFEKRKLFIMA